MKTTGYKGKRGAVRLGLPLALIVPAALCALFEALKGDRAVMDGWVFGVMGPAERLLGRLWSVFPFSVAEVLIALVLAGSAAWVVRAVVLLVRGGGPGRFVRRLLAVAAVWLWLLAGLNWLWNAGYYASGFSARSGLDSGGCQVEELRQVTQYFAQRAAELAGQMERDEEGHFAHTRDDCLDRGLGVYGNLEEEFECLAGVTAVRAKPLVFSRLQGILGFTGMYFPFTGEANVNVDAPACLLPATIAHEMAHQRMVASESEANFVGIAACVTSDDVVYQYSGYLMGLIHLSNALYSADREAWYAVRAAFSPELITDWNDNNAYWAALDSKAEEVAEGVYDSFLKENDQQLGMRSYGACVDLLVEWQLRIEN